MAAGEDQPQPVVAHRAHLLGRARRRARAASAACGVPVVAGRLPAEPVDGPVAGRGDDPAARVGRHAVDRPALDGDGERLLDRLLGEVDVAEDADQGGDDPAVLLAEDRSIVPRRPARRATAPARPGTGAPRRGRCRRRCALRGPVERGVEVGGLDDPEAAEVLLGLGERAVGDEHVAVRPRGRPSRSRRVQAAAEHPRTLPLDLLVHRGDVGVHPLDHVRRRQLLAVDHVHGQQILRHLVPPLGSSDRHRTDLYQSYERRPAQIDSCDERVASPVSPFPDKELCA